MLDILTLYKNISPIYFVFKWNSEAKKIGFYHNALFTMYILHIYSSDDDLINLVDQRHPSGF